MCVALKPLSLITTDGALIVYREWNRFWGYMEIQDMASVIRDKIIFYLWNKVKYIQIERGDESEFLNSAPPLLVLFYFLEILCCTHLHIPKISAQVFPSQASFPRLLSLGWIPFHWLPVSPSMFPTIALSTLYF